jgi:hypothetical protein
LFIRISILIGFSSPSEIVTSSIAAAESECIETRPFSNGIRERPWAMSSASATRTTPPRARTARRRAVRDDRLEHLGGDHGQLGLLVDPVEQPADLRLDEEEAELLVPLAVDRHADVVQERAEDDDDLGVVVRHAEVADDRRLDVRAWSAGAGASARCS